MAAKATNARLKSSVRKARPNGKTSRQKSRYYRSESNKRPLQKGRYTTNIRWPTRSNRLKLLKSQDGMISEECKRRVSVA